LLRAFGASRGEVFKAAALRGLQALFPRTHNPFHAGFLGRVEDVVALERNNCPPGRIFIVNENRDVRIAHRPAMTMSIQSLHEMLHELFPAVRGQLMGESCSICFHSFCDLVDEDKMSKNVHHVDVVPTGTPVVVTTAQDQFADHNFWRLPLPPIDDF
jgi:phosphatidate phosphatase PAH1